MKTCFFDLETEYLIQDLDPETPSLSFKEKQSRRGKIVPRLNLAVACVLGNDEGSTTRYFEKAQLVRFRLPRAIDLFQWE
jgi:hypothetical protein